MSGADIRRVKTDLHLACRSPFRHITAHDRHRAPGRRIIERHRSQSPTLGIIPVYGAAPRLVHSALQFHCTRGFKRKREKKPFARRRQRESRRTHEPCGIFPLRVPSKPAVRIPVLSPELNFQTVLVAVRFPSHRVKRRYGDLGASRSKLYPAQFG